MALNARETRVLLTLGAILLAGGVVRYVSDRHPHWTPGVVRSIRVDSTESADAEPPPESSSRAGSDAPRKSMASQKPGPEMPDRKSGSPRGRAVGPQRMPLAARRLPRAADRFGTAADLDSLFVDGKLDLNAAGEAHLVLLPRIGPSLAARVVEHRRSHGPFRRVEDLMEVRGIGPKTLEMLRDHVCVRP